jgi:hypothetical protein
MMLYLNRTEDQDLIAVFHCLITPTPGMLCRNAIESYRLGLPFPEPLINTKAEVPKDARNHYVVSLTPEEEEFFLTFRDRQKGTVLRLLLRKALWSYCLLFLQRDRECTATEKTPERPASVPKSIPKKKATAPPKPRPSKKGIEKPKDPIQPIPEPTEPPKAAPVSNDPLDLFNQIIGG